MRGDSFRRQTALADAYAAKHGLVLDNKLRLHDFGVSAFRGKNAVEGNLGRFIEHVRSGEVPQGSLLLVESLDRLSRQEVATAQLSFLNLLNSGVRVVTLLDGEEYSWESANGSGGVQLVISLLLMSRAHEESATKGRRLKEAWEAKRADLANRPLTGRLPAWLRLSPDGGTIEVIEDRAALVRRIFRLSLEGVGQHKIAATFNHEGIAPWGRAKFWHRSYVAKVLANPAVIGTVQPHELEHDGFRKRRKALEATEGYFPAVVDRETFQEVQALRQTLGAPQRGRHAHAPVSNILASLAACPQCGATMTRVAKGKRSRPTFVCTRAKLGAGCPYRSVPYQAVQDAILVKLPERLEAGEGIGAGEELDRAIQGAGMVVDRLKKRASNYLDNLGTANSPAIVRRLTKTEGALEEAEGRLKELQERQEAATGRTIGARIKLALEALQPPEGAVDVALVNRALRSLFTRAVIDWRTGTIELEWTHGGSLPLPYTTNFEATPGWSWGNEEQSNDD